MNKKQAGIIVTLLALIVCAGILAAKVNSPVDPVLNGVATEDSNPFTFGNDSATSKENKEDTKATSGTGQSAFFNDAKLQRNQVDSQTLATLKTIIDDENVSQEEKDNATQKYTKKAMSKDYEARIELALKGKGFEDVLCTIEEEKARVIVKGKEISPQQRKQIQDVVMSVAQIKNVEIEMKE